MENTLYWYDLETFGRNPAWDKVAQFAGVRTNEKFEIVGEPLVLYCKITPDYIPDPVACYITGISPQQTLEMGLTEYEFIKRIDKEFSVPGTCVVGYNSINFDDEFIRNLYYRNFKDPYIREWNKGNSRWDIINLVRGAHDFRPDNIKWIRNDEGKPSFRLEELSKANGIKHENAHDALSDVFATIEIAKLIHKNQPRFFSFYYQLRKKENVKKIIDIYKRTPFYNTSAMFTSTSGCTTMLVPLSVDPNNKNSIICYDLRYDPKELLELSCDQIREQLFTPEQDLTNNQERIHLKCVHINKSPLIAPLGTLSEEASLRLGINNAECFENLKKINESPDIHKKVSEIYSVSKSNNSINTDPDFQIYTGGFFRDEDKAKFTLIHNTRKEDLPNLKIIFEDKRCNEMFWRFICRNFPETLINTDLEKWKSFCSTRLLIPPTADVSDINTLVLKLTDDINSKEIDNKNKIMIKTLLEYLHVLKKRILS